MRRLLIIAFVFGLPVWAKSAGPPAHVLDPVKQILRHRQHEARRGATLASRADQPAVPAVRPDVGQIAVLDEADGVVTASGFDLDQRTLQLRPGGTNASEYTYEVGASRFDAEAVRTATAVRLDDDDAREVPLPFSFPFYGLRYNSVFIHSDGNVTFGVAEASSFERDFVRLVVGPPRAGPLFADLDPSQPEAAVNFVSGPSRFLITWSNVPLYAENPGPQIPRQTLQAALYPDGRIEFSYRGINITQAVVGVAPGGATRIEQVTFVDFTTPSTIALSNAIVEEFSNDPQFDFIALSRKFYRNHEDSYDFLVVFDTAQRDFQFCAAAVPIRNWVRGLGLRAFGIAEEFDSARVFGSAGRMQNIIYMGPLSRYPADPAEVRALPGCGRNSTLSILGQETGHRFLAYTRFMDPATGRPSTELLGRDLAHWSFYFNSDASFAEGNQIEDKGQGVSPRFETKQIVQRFSELDQYLMGLRAPEEVRPTFLVREPSIDFPRNRAPQSGVFFEGTRLEITVPMIVAAEGRRVPDHTLSPKQFRFAFSLLIPAGAEPPAADIAKLDRIRTEWETVFARAVDNRARAETRLVKQLGLSVWPASGLLQGRTVTASVSLGAPAAAPVTVNLASSSGAVTVPGSVTIPAGRRSAEFPVTGNSAGIAELTARGPDDSYETSRASLQVRGAASGLRLEQLWVLALDFGLFLPAPETGASGGLGVTLPEELIFRVRDENFLPYPGLRINASASGAGSVAPANLVTDARGWVRINWRLDTTPGLNTLTLMLDGQPDITARAQVVGAPQPPRRREVRTPADPIP